MPVRMNVARIIRIIAWNAPIITREEHEVAMGQAREIIELLRRDLRQLSPGRIADHREDEPEF